MGGFCLLVELAPTRPRLVEVRKALQEISKLNSLPANETQLDLNKYINSRVFTENVIYEVHIS